MSAPRPKSLALLFVLATTLGLALSGYTGRDREPVVPRGREAPRPTDAQERVASAPAATPTGRSLPTEQPVTRCRVPVAPILKNPACKEGAPYPACRWRMPHPVAVGSLYSQWLNTGLERWWGRPALVSLVLATAREYARSFPGEVLAVGDLDAPGPRHETHENGVDVDLYLPGMMLTENLGRSEYEENYEGQSPLAIRVMQGRVEALARVLAECSGGRVRIYYNDRTVQHRFRDWFRKTGLVSPFGRPMQSHNDLHRFHFHVTVPEDLAVLPTEDP